jgi:hypothetical protein
LNAIKAAIAIAVVGACVLAVGQTAIRVNDAIVLSGNNAVTTAPGSVRIKGVKIPKTFNGAEYSLSPAAGASSATKVWEHAAQVGQGHPTDYVSLVLDNVGLRLNTTATGTSATVILYIN